MWGNLAGRLVNTDLNATLEKIGNVVAPRQDDEYDDDEDDDYEEEEEDDEEVYENENENENEHKNDDHDEDQGRSFGLVSMLTRALDNKNDRPLPQQMENNNNNNNNNNGYEEEEDDDEGQSEVDEVAFTTGPITNNNTPLFFSQDKDRMETSTTTTTTATTTSLPPPTSSSHDHVEPRLLSPLDVQQQSLPVIIPPQTAKNSTTKDRSDEDANEHHDPAVAAAAAAAAFHHQPELQQQPQPQQRRERIPMETKQRPQPEQLPATHQFETTLVTSAIAATTTTTTEIEPIDMVRRRNEEAAVDTPRLKREEEEEEEQEKKMRQEEAQVTRRQGQLSRPLPTQQVQQQEVECLIQEAETNRRVEQPEILQWKVAEEQAEQATRNADVVQDLRRLTTIAQPQYQEKQQWPSHETETKSREDERFHVQIPQKLEEEETKEGMYQPVDLVMQSNKNQEAPAQGRVAETTTKVRSGHNDDHVQRPPTPEYHESTRHMETEFKCRELQTRLEMAEQEIVALRKEAQREQQRVQAEKEDLMARFQDKEARLLKATNEANEDQAMTMKYEFQQTIEALEQKLSHERQEFAAKKEEYQRQLMESNAKCDRVENQIQAVVKRFENEISQSQQREERALSKADDRVAQTMAVLDERNEEISHLKALIRDMESKVNEHEEGVEEAEEELEELQHENDSLREMIEKLQKDNAQLKDKVESLQHDSETLAGLQMEMTMIQEDLSRERSKNQSVVDSAISSHTQVEAERDTALSELRDVKQQLAAALGDLEVARADHARIMAANTNLQAALEAFQIERQAELEIIDQQRLESEEAIKSAHEATISALKQTHEAQLYEVQKATNNTVQNAKNEMELLEGNIERLKSENNQMRRSLDEAIHRLQSTQEDVIDRNVMKNILLDWCMLKDQTKRHQVLEVMANLLHFSDEEREKVHLTSVDLDSVRARVVSALAAPLPPPKADVEHLEGSNVREKWINFLMAETDDG